MDILTRKKAQLGIFVLLGSALFITGIFLIGTKQNMFNKTFRIGAVFVDANGVRKGNYVWFSGVKVGVVDDITFINDTTIRIDMRIDKDVQSLIRKNAVARISSEGLVGNKIIQIKPGEGEADFVSENDLIQSVNPIDFNNALENLNATNNNLTEMTSGLSELITKINEGQGILHDLAMDTTLAGEFRSSVANLELTLQQSARIMEELDLTSKQFSRDDNLLNLLVEDTTAATSFEEILSNLKMTSQQTLDLTKSLGDLSIQAREGDGTVGVLLSDTTLAQDLKESTAKLNENLEALQHSILFRRYFRKKEKQQKPE